VFVNTVCREPVGFHLDDQTAVQLDAYFGMLKDAYEEIGPASRTASVGRPPAADVVDSTG
jgi:hypothetical protein